MTSVDVGGTRLTYIETGTGEPVVLVHGSASDHRTWQGQLPKLGARYRTIAYSRRYHWPNAPIPEGADYAMAEHVDDLQALLRAFRVAPAHLVGHSYGGFVCLRLAMREPRLVRRLVLIEPPIITLFTSPVPTPAELLGLLLRRPRTAAAILRFGALGIGPATAAARRGDMDAAIRAFGRAVLGREAYRRLSPARLEQARANAIRAEILGSGLPPVEDASVRAVAVPTLLVRGHDSPRLFHRVIDRLAELLPHATEHEIPAASHIVQEDNAPAFNAAVLSFLAA